MFIFDLSNPSIHLCCSHLEHRASVKRFISLQFLNLRQSVGLLGRGISPTQGCFLHRTTQTQNKRRQTSMPWVGFEPTIPAFERAKIFYAVDHCEFIFDKIAFIIYIAIHHLLILLKHLSLTQLNKISSRQNSFRANPHHKPVTKEATVNQDTYWRDESPKRSINIWDSDARQISNVSLAAERVLVNVGLRVQGASHGLARFVANFNLMLSSVGRRGGDKEH
jgi:hypothetical protein